MWFGGVYVASENIPVCRTLVSWRGFLRVALWEHLWVVVAMDVDDCAAAAPRVLRAWRLGARVSAGLRLAPRVGSAGCCWARRRWCGRFVMTSIFCCA